MSFEDTMMKRLADCHTEACNEILASVRAGRSLSDAVTDTVEALPASKTRDLRQWLEEWEAWEEWKNWEAAGWKIKRKGGEIYVISPHRYPGDGPSVAEVRAGAGVRVMRYIGDTSGDGFADDEAKDLAGYNQSRRGVVLVTQYHVVHRTK